MKIDQSAIAMTSSHRELSYTHAESTTIEASAASGTLGAILTLSQSEDSKGYQDSIKQYEKQQAEEQAQRQKENNSGHLREMLEGNRSSGVNPFMLPQELDMKIKMLREILAALRGEKSDFNLGLLTKNTLQGIFDLRSPNFKAAEQTDTDAANAPIQVGTTATGTVWQKITATSGFHIENEMTTFATTGIVKTKDGRSIDFNLEVSMTRSFTSQIDSLEVQQYIKTDPLIINLDSDIATVTDQKFAFDLDSDGRSEQISFAGEGSGFLALDKNGDGIINDGSELFGTKTGDGFAELAAYDEDGNGWIDENDSVFKKLKIWTKDSEGNDYLLTLKKADVGAIYLGSSDTQFSLKNDDNKLNAEIRKTGIYLKESTGVAGTVNHVDLVL